MNSTTRRVAVLGGSRIPFCRSNSLYADLSNLDMMSAALNGLTDKYALKGQHIDEVVGGAVVTHSKDFNLAREAVLSTKLAPSTPGVTMIQACGTSLQAALGSAAKIATGEIDSAIACGSDTTSDAPIVFSKKFSKRLVDVGMAKTPLDKLKVFKGLSPAELAPAGMVVAVLAVRYGRHLPEAVEFVKTFALLHRPPPLALASVNLTARKPGKDTTEGSVYLRKLIAHHRLKPALATAFAGKLDYPRYGFFDKHIIRFIMLMTGGPTDPATVFGPMISRSAADRILATIETAVSTGAGELLLGGNRIGGALAI